MNFFGVILTILLVLIVVMMPRRWAAFGFMASVCYMTQGQAINVGGFHFHAVRIVLLAGFIRIIARGEFRQWRLNNIDGCVLAFAIYTCVVGSMRLGAWQEQFGVAYNVLLSYVVFRCLVTNWEETQEFILGMAYFIIPMALAMLLELTTGKNIFDVMGGHEVTSLREGRLRCVGAFRGPHTAGAFGATLMPLFVGLYFTHVHRRRILVAGLIATAAITYASNSSGPLMAYLSGMVGLAFWPLRTKMRKVRWGIVVFLIVMGLLMKAPIWYLLSKVADLTGGDGWYRSYLMEQCYNHFGDWWLAGTNDTSQWAVTLMTWGGADLCNMYVSCAANAGLGCLLLFVLILVKSFQNLGRALNVAREILPESEALLWCLGTVLFAHAVTLTSVTYWDQMQVAWWAFVALISSATSAILKTEPAPAAIIEVEQEPQRAEAMR